MTCGGRSSQRLRKVDKSSDANNFLESRQVKANNPLAKAIAVSSAPIGVTSPYHSVTEVVSAIACLQQLRIRYWVAVLLVHCQSVRDDRHAGRVLVVVSAKCTERWSVRQFLSPRLEHSGELRSPVSLVCLDGKGTSIRP
jgi:hypothetical protein